MGVAGVVFDVGNDERQDEQRQEQNRGPDALPALTLTWALLARPIVNPGTSVLPEARRPLHE